jgi:hypothetical protein
MISLYDLKKSFFRNVITEGIRRKIKRNGFSIKTGEKR